MAKQDVCCSERSTTGRKSVLGNGNEEVREKKTERERRGAGPEEGHCIDR